MTSIFHLPAKLWDAIVLTPYFTAHFICRSFIIAPNHVSTSFIAVLPSVCARMYCMLNVRLFLRLQLVPHTRTLCPSSYMFDAPMFLRPQLEPRARHIILISTTAVVPSACAMQRNILSVRVFLPPQFVPNRTRSIISAETGVRLNSHQRRGGLTLSFIYR
jgi:hypothetical protein